MDRHSKMTGRYLKAADMPADPSGSLDAMGSVIRKYRKQAGFTQADLAGRLDVKRNTVVSWETGRSRPSMETLIRLSHLLHVPIAELFHVQVAAADLTETEKDFLDRYRKLSPENRRIAARMVRCMREEETAERTKRLLEDYRPIRTLQTPAAAGSGCDYLDSEAFGIRYYRKNARCAAADIVCRVEGHSMEPFYHDGDLVYGKQAVTAGDGQDVICDSNDGRLIKRRYGNRLVSLNRDPAYEVRKSPDDDVRIVAVVLGIVPEGDIAGPETETELEELHQQV